MRIALMTTSIATGTATVTIRADDRTVVVACLVAAGCDGVVVPTPTPVAVDIVGATVECPPVVKPAELAVVTASSCVASVLPGLVVIPSSDKTINQFKTIITTVLLIDQACGELRC